MRVVAPPMIFRPSFERGKRRADDDGDRKRCLLDIFRLKPHSQKHKKYGSIRISVKCYFCRKGMIVIDLSSRLFVSFCVCIFICNYPKLTNNQHLLAFKSMMQQWVYITALEHERPIYGVKRLPCLSFVLFAKTAFKRVPCSLCTSIVSNINRMKWADWQN